MVWERRRDFASDSFGGGLPSRAPAAGRTRQLRRPRSKWATTRPPAASASRRLDRQPGTVVRPGHQADFARPQICCRPGRSSMQPVEVQFAGGRHWPGLRRAVALRVFQRSAAGRPAIPGRTSRAVRRPRGARARPFQAAPGGSRSRPRRGACNCVRLTTRKPSSLHGHDQGRAEVDPLLAVDEVDGVRAHRVAGQSVSSPRRQVRSR